MSTVDTLSDNLIEPHSQRFFGDTVSWQAAGEEEASVVTAQLGRQSTRIEEGYRIHERELVVWKSDVSTVNAGDRKEDFDTVTIDSVPYNVVEIINEDNASFWVRAQNRVEVKKARANSRVRY